MAEELSINASPTLPSTARCGFPSFLEIQDYIKQPSLKDSYHKLNKKCVLLLKNLINEQKIHSFDEQMKHNKFDAANVGQFKFFLNTLEIFCHDLDIINLHDYLYRTQDYGRYETYMDDLFLRKVDKGTIITLQTYNSTLQNTIISHFQQKLFDTRGQSENQEILLAYNNYAFHASQYNVRLRNIFKELRRLHQVISQVHTDIGNEITKNDSIFYIEGIWNPISKVFHESHIKKVLKAFELALRNFERALIQLVITLVDIRNKEQALENPQSKLQISSPSALYPFSGMKSLMNNDDRENICEFSAAKIVQSNNSKMLPSSGTFKNRFKNSDNVGPRIALSDLSTGKNHHNIVQSPEKERKFVLNKCLQKDLDSESVCKFSTQSVDLKSEFDDNEKVELTYLISNFKSSKTSKTEFCPADITLKKETSIVSNLSSKFERLKKYHSNSLRFNILPNQENTRPSNKDEIGYRIPKNVESRRVSDGNYFMDLVNTMDSRNLYPESMLVNKVINEKKTIRGTVKNTDLLKIR